jgi:hypothetical protein
MMKGEKVTSKFMLCIRNDGLDDLEQRKVYQVLPDKTALQEGFLRVIDESGEDYLYPAEYFAPVKLPVAIERDLMSPRVKLQTTAHKTHSH